MRIRNDFLPSGQPAYDLDPTGASAPFMWYGGKTLDGTISPWKDMPVGSIYIYQYPGIGSVWYMRQAVADATASWGIVLHTNIGLSQYGTQVGAQSQAQDFGATYGIKTNLIAESGAGAGVTADGVKMKDGGIVGADGAVLEMDTINEATTDAGVTVEGVKMEDGGVILADAAVLEADTINEATADAGVTIELVAIENGSIITPDGASIEVDTINEATAAHGVIVEGVTLKDGAATTAASLALVAGAAEGNVALIKETPTYVGDGIVATISLAVGGTGYATADTLAIVQAGGAGATATIDTVDAEVTGVITGITLGVGGTGYAVEAALATTVVLAATGKVTTISIGNGGTGYSVNDVLTVVQAGGSTCTVTVSSVAAGVVDGITLTTRGSGYGVENNLATTVAPDNGTGCLIDIDSIDASGATIDIDTLTARTIAIHNYIAANNPTVSNGAAVTAAALVDYDAAIGTHPGLQTGSTKTTPTGVDAWIPINANGTLVYIPCYSSKTA